MNDLPLRSTVRAPSAVLSASSAKSAPGSATNATAAREFVRAGRRPGSRCRVEQRARRPVQPSPTGLGSSPHLREHVLAVQPFAAIERRQSLDESVGLLRR